MGTTDGGTPQCGSGRAPWIDAAWIALVLALPSPAAVADDAQAWFATTVAGPVVRDSRALVSLELQARFRNDARELDVAAVQPTVGWRATPNVDLWVGAADVQARRAGPDIHERRVLAQATARLGPWLDGRWTSRTRLERRTRDAGDDAGWRLREQLKYAHAFASHPAFGVVVSDELFYLLNDTDWGQRRGVEQNRAFVGGSWQASTRLRVEAGYLNQHVRRPGSVPDVENHVAMLTLAVAL